MPRRLHITRHAAERIRERWTHYGPVLALWEKARPLPPQKRAHLVAWCPAHQGDLAATSDARAVYWYRPASSLWRVFVAAAVAPGLYSLLTYFETPCKRGVPLPPPASGATPSPS